MSFQVPRLILVFMLGVFASHVSADINAVGSAEVALVEPIPGEFYDNARNRMLAAGWQPIRAKCSPRNMCFDEYPEVATRIKENKTCGSFHKEKSTARICVRPISDALKVTTFEYVR